MCLCLCVCVCVYELRVYELGVYIRTCLHIHFQLWYMMPLRPLPNNYLVHKNLAYFCCVNFSTYIQAPIKTCGRHFSTKCFAMANQYELCISKENKYEEF